ncbi:hypothetical protein K443DRAFT_213128 [Laccaria amethystina LaAM-08-1]|uniref:Uncharacterized protein n=1 Tax=Laccaria amethystina LaAM-08-1 TaxID=1095629 RepID=A0A0C9XQI2_9AGAR|nr:hypothetical protein K443DRAFT_213128 [Laccaria amethystina LaAM-08-1]
MDRDLTLKWNSSCCLVSVCASAQVHWGLVTVTKSSLLFITPPNCNNVVDSQKLKRDQGLRPSVTSLDGIFSQHTHPANTSVSPGRSWQYLSGQLGTSWQPSLRKFIFSTFLPGHICRCSCSYLSIIYKGQ